MSDRVVDASPSFVPTLSVAVVTYGREPLLPLLLAQFDAQSHPAAELIVIDDSPSPSASLGQLGRPDVRYVHLERRLPVGAKRNLALELVRSEQVVQWDDDDYYAPHYLAFAAAQLAEVEFCKLDRFFVLQVDAGRLGYWDTRRPPPDGAGLSPEQAAAWTERNQLGYGFCYCYRRAVLAAVRSPETSIGDDYAFARGVVDRGFTVRLLADQQGLALHLLHDDSLSRCFTDRWLDDRVRRTLFPGFDLSRHRRALAEVGPRERPPC